MKDSNDEKVKTKNRDEYIGVISNRTGKPKYSLASVWAMSDCILENGRFVSEKLPLIVCCNTGVFWENDAGHHEILNPWAEGYVVPLDSCCIPKECGYFQHYDEDQFNEVIKKIDKALCRYCDKIVEKICFDHERSYQFFEGWVPVNVWIGSIFSDPKKGYICYDNCD